MLRCENEVSFWTKRISQYEDGGCLPPMTLPNPEFEEIDPREQLNRFVQTQVEMVRLLRILILLQFVSLFLSVVAWFITLKI